MKPYQEKLLEVANKVAVDMFEREGLCMPLIIAAAEGREELRVIALEGVSKATAGALRDQLIQQGETVCCLWEAWTHHYTDEERAQIRAGTYLDVPPKLRPDRQEVVLVSYFEPQGRTVLQSAQILRDGDKKPTLAPWKRFDTADGEQQVLKTGWGDDNATISSGNIG